MGEVLSADEVIFREHPDRRYWIRLPRAGEYELEFRSLGPHLEDRRRVILARVDGWKARVFGVKVMAVPFLLFADEEVRNEDGTLGPIFDGIMEEARGAG